MKTIFVTTEEWYPVLVPREHDNSIQAMSYTKYEVDEAVLARWKRIMEEFNSFQAELEKLAPKS